MRIDEGEGGVGGERDALARRGQARRRGAGSTSRARGQLLNAGEIAMALGEIGEAIEATARDRHARAPAPARDGARADASASSRGMAPTTGMPSVAMARSIMARWRSLPTRFSTTPAMRTRGSKLAKPCTTAAADCAWPATSSTSRTGRSKADGKLGGGALARWRAGQRRRTAPWRIRRSGDRRRRRLMQRRSRAAPAPWPSCRD